ncbi:4Fe-4S dicluster domain-containing protein [Metaclostridioides mangenotii]|uniref:4Fe-4S dicluster domain-containing protein n=1 Tax=Metaclostridioides mangenotii TaxID=1540 RepID=UPI000462EEE4|nr:4Fe-4S dicluster domain-containing protein [Clostridioides mangenotii]
MKKKAVVDKKLCVSCGSCFKVCPVKAIEIVKGIYAEIDKTKCVGCGRCVKECPASVISLQEV